MEKLKEINKKNIRGGRSGKGETTCISPRSGGPTEKGGSVSGARSQGAGGRPPGKHTNQLRGQDWGKETNLGEKC